MHMVSAVPAVLRDGFDSVDGLDALMASFHAGAAVEP
jgi:anthranilate/para-aminobenzoate synthase component I